MEIEEGDEPISAEKVAEMKKDVKGKQRAVEHYESPKREHRKKQRQPVFTLRPILTIQKSQGFVWNQVSYYKLDVPCHCHVLTLRPRTRTSSYRHTSKTDVRTLPLLLFLLYSHEIGLRVCCVDQMSRQRPPRIPMASCHLPCLRRTRP